MEQRGKSGRLKNEHMRKVFVIEEDWKLKAETNRPARTGTKVLRVCKGEPEAPYNT